jgi:hypothetical protein
MVAVGLLLLLISRSCSPSTNSGGTAPAATTATAPTPPPAASNTPILIPRYECDTPCTTTISWPFRIGKSGGRTITISVNGGEPVTYGPGDFKPPEVFGKYVIATPDDPPVHIRVYERRGNWP